MVITDPLSNKPGFPTNFDPSATASLGYAAKMLEAGVQVVYTYIADAHDPQRLNIPNAPPAPEQRPCLWSGRGGLCRGAQDLRSGLWQVLCASQGGWHRRDNTLFVVVPDENDHFVGGTAEPGELRRRDDALHLHQCRRDRASHSTRSCSGSAMNSTPFSVHSDDAPNMYINTNPATDRHASPGPWSMTSTRWSPPTRSPATPTSCRCCWPTGPK